MVVVVLANEPFVVVHKIDAAVNVEVFYHEVVLLAGGDGGHSRPQAGAGRPPLQFMADDVIIRAILPAQGDACRSGVDPGEHGLARRGDVYPGQNQDRCFFGGVGPSVFSQQAVEDAVVHDDAAQIIYEGSIGPDLHFHGGEIPAPGVATEYAVALQVGFRIGVPLQQDGCRLPDPLR